jgi:hypothetical protein
MRESTGAETGLVEEGSAGGSVAVSVLSCQLWLSDEKNFYWKCEFRGRENKFGRIGACPRAQLWRGRSTILPGSERNTGEEIVQECRESAEEENNSAAGMETERNFAKLEVELKQTLSSSCGKTSSANGIIR